MQLLFARTSYLVASKDTPYLLTPLLCASRYLSCYIITMVVTRSPYMASATQPASAAARIPLSTSMPQRVRFYWPAVSSDEGDDGDDGDDVIYPEQTAKSFHGVIPMSRRVIQPLRSIWKDPFPFETLPKRDSASSQSVFERRILVVGEDLLPGRVVSLHENTGLI